MPFTLHFLSHEVILHSQLSNIFRQTSVHSPFCVSVMIQHNIKTDIIHSKSGGGEEEARLKRTLKAGPLLNSATDSSCNLCVPFGNCIA